MVGTLYEKGRGGNVVIDRLVDPDVIYPYYRKGAFHGLPDNLSAAGFHELISSASSFVTFESACFDGQLVCVFELRAMSGERVEDFGLNHPHAKKRGIQYETHANWLTLSRRKRTMVLDCFLERHKDKDLVTFVHPDESKGHHGFVKRGKMTYMGEVRHMNVFGNCRCLG